MLLLSIARSGITVGMKRLRLLNPFRIRAVVRQIREVSVGGGPAQVRIAGIDRPRGWIIPTSQMHLEVRAKDGTVTRFDPDLPLPFPYAWAYRVARGLRVPLVRSFDPEDLDVSVKVPGRGGAAE